MDPIQAEKDRIEAILSQHKDKNFVQRVIDPTTVPSLDMGNGNYGTHLMSYSTNDKGAVVYPEIVQDKQTGKLVRLKGDEAYKHAMKNNEYIPFDKAADADWFTKNYKKVWQGKYDKGVAPVQKVIQPLPVAAPAAAAPVRTPVKAFVVQ